MWISGKLKDLLYCLTDTEDKLTATKRLSHSVTIQRFILRKFQLTDSYMTYLVTAQLNWTVRNRNVRRRIDNVHTASCKGSHNETGQVIRSWTRIHTALSTIMLNWLKSFIIKLAFHKTFNCSTKTWRITDWRKDGQ